ncbi:uracil-DNA glycosylase family protein [Chitinimonas sp. BJYL2]|uniref:uracil-DNA glycosylase n=1 Tax=Chitinimonas sp. BJYL2 TaxID=2976696 RepID=UPI0022B4F629|nr:uracil-DNA glycosylase family protein [Chitinimonas sp. BJYL2]
MSTEHTPQILEELDLLPLWVRRELLAQADEAATAGASAPPAAITEIIASRPDPAPTIAPRSLSSAAAVIAPPGKPDAAVEEDTAKALDHRARATRIAQLDWATLQTEVSGCTACGLCKSRSKTVFGVGNPQADWLVVGEAPGAEEDRQGEPFVGQAGKLLDSMLTSIDRSRSENVYILNTLKCRPPQNRNPEPDELALCAPFLHRQIELIQPKLIFAVGRFAVQTILGREATISSLRGKLHDYRGIPVVVSYHPAYLLRNLPDKAKAWQDLVLATQTLGDKG